MVSFNNVNLPIVVFLAEHDTLTPYWKSDLIKQNVKNPALITIKTVENAGHLSFLAPFPESMRNKKFPPSQDPDGFYRETFHETLKVEVLDFFNKQFGNKVIIEEKAHNKANSADAKRGGSADLPARQ